MVKEKKLLTSRDMVNLKHFSAKEPFEQKLVRLPLSDDGKQVDHVVTLAVWEKV